MWINFITVLIISIPAVLVQAKSSVALVNELTKDEEKRVPARQVYAGVIVQNFILIILSALFGSYFLSTLDASSMIFQSLGTAESLIPGVIGGVLAGVYIAGLYFGFFRSWMGEKATNAIDKFRLELGLVNKILSGGIFEEVMFRFGIQSLLYWVGLVLLGLGSAIAAVLSIIITSILFSVMHIPSIKLAGAEINAKTVTASLTLNFGVSIVFGYLYFAFGLLAAMIAHGLLHVIWYTVDRQVLVVK